MWVRFNTATVKINLHEDAVSVSIHNLRHINKIVGDTRTWLTLAPHFSVALIVMMAWETLRELERCEKNRRNLFQSFTAALNNTLGAVITVHEVVFQLEACLSAISTAGMRPENVALYRTVGIKWVML
jgi:hypothetical protein